MHISIFDQFCNVQVFGGEATVELDLFNRDTIEDEQDGEAREICAENNPQL